jgi:hypothetical protein
VELTLPISIGPAPNVKIALQYHFSFLQHLRKLCGLSAMMRVLSGVQRLSSTLLASPNASIAAAVTGGGACRLRGWATATSPAEQAKVRLNSRATALESTPWPSMTLGLGNKRELSV